MNGSKRVNLVEYPCDLTKSGLSVKEKKGEGKGKGKGNRLRRRLHTYP